MGLRLSPLQQFYHSSSFAALETDAGTQAALAVANAGTVAFIAAVVVPSVFDPPSVAGDCVDSVGDSESLSNCSNRDFTAHFGD